MSAPRGRFGLGSLAGPRRLGPVQYPINVGARCGNVSFNGARTTETALVSRAHAGCEMTTFVGTDIGGTFTDLVGFDSERGSLVFGKRLTTTTDLVEAVMTCLDDVGITSAQVDVLKHGTTQVINTLLERRGARTALIATREFGDVLEIGRAGRPVAFKLDYQRNRPLVPQELRFELDERIAADGCIVRELEAEEMEELAARIEAQAVEALAISFVNAYRNPTHERQALAFFQQRLPSCYVTIGTALSRQWFEFERASTPCVRVVVAFNEAVKDESKIHSVVQTASG